MKIFKYFMSKFPKSVEDPQNPNNKKRNTIFIVVSIIVIVMILYNYFNGNKKPTKKIEQVSKVKMESIREDDFGYKDNTSFLKSIEHEVSDAKKESLTENALILKDIKALQDNNKAMNEKLAFQNEELKTLKMKKNITPTSGINNNDNQSNIYENAVQSNQYVKPAFEFTNLSSFENTKLLDEIEEKNEEEFYLNPENFVPAGTFCKAISLGGADASTSTNAQSDTTPMLFELTGNCSLPNGKKSHLKGARIVASVFGEISSERGRVRLQSMSFVDKEKNEILDIPVEGTAFDVTGKNGIRGKLVLRNNKILMAAGISGLLSGLGTAIQGASTDYSVNPVGTVETVQGAGNIAANAVGGGLSQGIGKISDYYIKLADQYSPIIEVNAGALVDIVFLKGFPIKNKKAIKKYENSVAFERKDDVKNQNQSIISQTKKTLGFGDNDVTVPSLDNIQNNVKNQATNKYDDLLSN